MSTLSAMLVAGLALCAGADVPAVATEPVAKAAPNVTVTEVRPPPLHTK